MIRILFAVLILAAGIARAADGDPDAAFGYLGTSYLNWSTYPLQQTVRKVLPMPDGRVVLVGYVDRFSVYDYSMIGVARLLPNGFFDTTFGDASTPGQMLIVESDEAEAYDAALDSSGSIYIAGALIGNGFLSNSSATLWHVTSAGALDTSFGTSGRTIISRGGVAFYDTFKSLLIGNGNNLPSYQIVLGGSTQDPGYPQSYAIFVISTDGGIASGFGNISLPDGGSYWRAGVYCAGGSGSPTNQIVSLAFNPAYPSSSTTYLYAAAQCSDTGNSEATILAFNSSTLLDSNFGIGGISHFHFDDGATSISVPSQIAIARDGSGALFVSGTASQDDGTQQMALAKVASSGSFDPAFGNAGHALYDVASGCCAAQGNSTGIALLVQADGKILLGGSRNVNGDPYDFSVLRVNGNDGTLDPSWGSDGALAGARAYRIPISQSTGDNALYSMAFTSGPENLLIGGYTVDPAGTTLSNFGAMRIHNDAIFADGFQ